jgi:hypothetical protein
VEERREEERDWHPLGRFLKRRQGLNEINWIYIPKKQSNTHAIKISRILLI